MCCAAHTMRWPYRGPTRGSAYRMIGGRSSSLDDREAPSLALMDKAFGRPAPDLEWTGNGVRSDARGRLQFVRHAIERMELRLPPEEMATIEAAKLLVLELLRSQSTADVHAWLMGGPDASARVAVDTIRTLTATVAPLEAGEQVVISYEPAKRRTRIVWPTGPATDLHDPEYMRVLWRAYLDDPTQPELKSQLTRWT